MENGNIAEFSAIKKENLKADQYTFSLLTEAYRNGLIEDKKMAAFQYNIMELVTMLLTKYTNGRSNSVPQETAQRIFASVSYCLDIYSMSFREPVECLKVLQNQSIKVYYERAMDFMDALIKTSKSIYEEILRTKPAISLEVYDATIVEGLKAFFLKYDKVFEAQNTILTLDYPLFEDNAELQGIGRINAYMKNLILENDFCNLFDAEDIQALLEDYGLTYNTDYKELIINIFEIMITNCIFSAMTGAEPLCLKISQTQCNLLYDNLISKTDEEINEKATAAIEDIIGNVEQRFIKMQAAGSDNETLDLILYEMQNSRLEELKAYIKKVQFSFVPKLIEAISNNNLTKFLIVHEEIPYAKEQFFDEGSTMNDANFRSVVKKLSGCSDLQQKIKIITSSIESLKDFVDILESESIFGEEFLQIFCTLGDIELSFLTRIIFEDELKYGSFSLTHEVLAATNSDSEWKSYFVRYLHSLSSSRLDEINKLLNAI